MSHIHMDSKTTLREIMDGVDREDSKHPATVPATLGKLPQYREDVATCEQCDKYAVIRIEAHSVRETRTAYQLIDGNESVIHESEAPCDNDSVEYYYCEDCAPDMCPEALEALRRALNGRAIPPTK